jgi:hypothetical protein
VFPWGINLLPIIWFSHGAGLECAQQIAISNLHCDRRRSIGSATSERTFQASQSAFTFRHTRLTVSLLTALPNTAASQPRQWPIPSIGLDSS